MTLAVLMLEAWLANILFFQTASIPIWVPLSIILLIILLLWWGLTRNSIPKENDDVAEHADEEGEQEIVEDEPASEDEVDPDTAVAPSGEMETSKAAKAEIEEPAQPSEPDDLKIIEGIGPKIAGLLADAGIATYADLAAADPERLNQIVRVEGGIKVADPSTWPEQAELAAEADWDGLEELQKRLVAGRHRT